MAEDPKRSGQVRPSRPARTSLAAVTLLVLAYTVVFSTVCVNKYRYYLYDDFDFAIFAQAMERMLHGSFYGSIRGMVWLGDHSSLILLPLLPLYAIFHHPVTLLVFQSLALGLGAWPVFSIARRELNHDAAAVAFAALYLMHPALGFLNLFEFHPESFAVPALLFTFRYLLEERVLAASIAAAAALLCREDVAIVVLAMASWVLVVKRRRGVRPAIVLVAMAAGSLALSFAVLKPAFNRGEVDYGAMYGAWGTRPAEILSNLLTHPLKAAAALVSTPGDPADTALKQHQHLFMLAPLLFLPLASPLTAAIALPILFVHFLSARTPQHSIQFQYTALVTPVLVVAAVRGARRLVEWLRSRPVEAADAQPAGRRRPGKARRSQAAKRRRHIAAPAIAGAVLASAIVCNVFYGPLTGGGKLVEAIPPQRNAPNALDRNWRPYRDRMLARIPRGVGVVAAFEYLSHLAAHENLHSAHHVFRGMYTFSSRPYPTPRDIGALLVDAGQVPLVTYIGQHTGERLRDMIALNRLAPVDAAGDLMLFARDARDTLRLFVADSSAAATPARTTFDSTIVFLGHDRLPETARPGGEFEVNARWRKVRPTTRLYFAGWVLIDADGRRAVKQLHPLGYVTMMPDAWLLETEWAERYRLVIPRDLPPGRYGVGTQLYWASGFRNAIAIADNPTVNARDGTLDLGTVEIHWP